MASINVRKRLTKPPKVERTAGGAGRVAAESTAIKKMRRLVLANLLWEDNFYLCGRDIVSQMTEVARDLTSHELCLLADEARNVQNLRHAPLLLLKLAAEKADTDGVREAVRKVCTRPDQLCELLALWWTPKKRPLRKCLQHGMRDAFERFSTYQLAKYKCDDKPVTLRDVMFVVHPDPRNTDVEVPMEATYELLANGKLAGADTWEVALSAGANKREAFERLLAENKLGDLAFLRNLRAMEEVEVDREKIRLSLQSRNFRQVMPYNFMSAWLHTSEYLKEDVNDAFERTVRSQLSIPGRTALVLDVSGSMLSKLSTKSEVSRLHAAAMLVSIGHLACEYSDVWLTAGHDYTRKHKTNRVNVLGSGMYMWNWDSFNALFRPMGGGGIFTRQCVDYIAENSSGYDRLVVVSDSQDCDLSPKKAEPSKVAPESYLIDISSHKNGVADAGLWTAELTGFTPALWRYVQEISRTRSKD